VVAAELAEPRVAVAASVVALEAEAATATRFVGQQIAAETGLPAAVVEAAISAAGAEHVAAAAIS
jgi:hypothetical protein